MISECDYGNTDSLLRTLAAETLDLALAVDLVELKHSKFGPTNPINIISISLQSEPGAYFLRLCLIFLGVV